MDRAPGATVLVAGLGDLGGRVLELLAGNTAISELLACGRRTPYSAALIAQTALIADTLGGAALVAHVETDLTDHAAVTQMLRSTAPDVVVFAASRHSWWRTPPAARSLPYGVWLPLQLYLLRTFMRAHRDAGATAPVVALPHPDAAGPVLAAEGLAPHAGAGNVAEVAAKLRLLAAVELGCRREQVDVHLVLHHAAERLAFALFAPSEQAGPRRPTDPGTAAPTPPYLARVAVRGEPLPADVVDRLLRQSYPLPTGTGSHQLTAATAVRLVDALLADEPQRLHVPAPAGLPGGYPVRVGGRAVVLDLPATITLAEAVAVNERAAAFDGISAIGPDGTVHYTEQATRGAQDVLGLRLQDVALTALDEVADQLDHALGLLHGA